jgi:hypothetical protein
MAIVSLFLFGCNGAKDFGYLPPEKYEEPPPIQFAGNEQGIVDLLSGAESPDAERICALLSVDQWKALAPLLPEARSAMLKIMRQKNAWRAIVRAHNEEADKAFKKMIERSGVKVESATLQPVKKF